MKTAVKTETITRPLPNLTSSIFIVDDDSLYCHSLAFFLKTHTNFEVYCYSTGEECIKHLDLKPKIIILDYYLSTTYPDAMDGLEVLKQIKKIKPQTKIVLLSGQETLSVATNALKLGAYTYVIKDAQTLDCLTKIIYELDKKT
jgi:DNA-binding NarL/FixJ family response regulator